MSNGLCLDSGALIAVERAQPRVVALLQRVVDRGGVLEVPATVLAQVWRGGARQARLATLLRAEGVRVVDLDHQAALGVGVICGAAGVADVVDGHVALHARRRDLVVLASDPDDISRLDPSLVVLAV